MRRSAAHLVAHEAPALGMSGVGKHVRDDERAHDAPTVALWNDGAHAATRAATDAARRAAPGRDRAELHAHRDRLGADLARRDARDLHCLRAGRRAPLADRPRSRLGDRRVRDAARLHRRAQAARRHPRATRRQHGRDPAPDRTLAARRRRLRGARRTHDLPRLRRAAGRRRHPLRVDHGRLRRARARVLAAAQRGAARLARR